MRSLLLTGQQFLHETPYFDPDARSYITAVETADAQVLEPLVRIAINTFVVGCKADGVWDAIKASCILAGARTLQGALVPLKGTAPTNFNFVAGDYSRTTGLLGDGTTKYLNSNRNHNVEPLNNRHVSVYASSKATGGNTLYAGTQFGEGNTILAVRNSTDIASRLSGQAGDILGIHGTGFMGLNRAQSTSITGRGNNLSVVVSANSNGPTSLDLSVFSGTAAFNPSNPRLAFYSFGESLDLALLDARVTTLINNSAFAINTGLNPLDYDADTIAYINAGYAAGGTLS